MSRLTDLQRRGRTANAVNNWTIAQAAGTAKYIRMKPTDTAGESQHHLNVHNLVDDSTEHPRALGVRFKKLAARWKNESRFMSSPFQMANLPSYRAIIGMGPAVIPLLLNELSNETDHWFFALWQLTGENPVPEDAAGDIQRMAQAWLRWGEQRHYFTRTR